MTAVRARAPDFGIQIVDVRIKRIGMADETGVVRTDEEGTSARRDAAARRGRRAVARIKADADRQRTVILSEAYRDAERIRGAGDARAAEIYAAAYSKDRDFYAFYRSMQAYRKSIGRDQDVLVLKPDSDFFQFLQNQPARRARLVPSAITQWQITEGLRRWPGLIFLRAWRSISMIEGLMPFVAPQAWRRGLAAVARLEDSQLRAFGLAVVIVGLLLLVAIRGCCGSNRRRDRDAMGRRGQRRRRRRARRPRARGRALPRRTQRRATRS